MPSQLPSLGGDSSSEFTGNPDFSRNDISSAVMGALPGMATTYLQINEDAENVLK